MPIEWPTLVLAGVIYGGWLALTWFHASIPLWLLVPLGGWFCAWQTSLQHEAIHGHPTTWRRINDAFGLPPLMLFLPYEAYRISHLVHHRDEHLTDPLEDPESYYWAPEDWARLSGIKRWLVTLQTTLAGRLLLGPAWVAGRFLGQELRAIIGGSRLHRRIWIKHLALVALVLTWVCAVCGMSFWLYVFAFVYPGTSLMLLRSFAEHKATDAISERIAIVENAPVMSLLYLNNNLHCVHHDRPALAWYEIPAWYKLNRDAVLRENGGLVYNGYLDVMRRYLFVSHDLPVHPAWPIKAPT